MIHTNFAPVYRCPTSVLCISGYFIHCYDTHEFCMCLWMPDKNFSVATFIVCNRFSDAQLMFWNMTISFGIQKCNVDLVF